MTDLDALMDPQRLPDFTALDASIVSSALDHAIARHSASVKRITQERPTDFTTAWLPLERADVALDALWSAVSHLHAVCDTPELRAAYLDGQQRLVAYSMTVEQDQDLYEVLASLAASPGFADLPQADRAAVEKTLRNFRLSGVALDAASRERFTAISVELSTLTSAFANAVLDATDAWSLHVRDEAELAGLSPADRAMFSAAAEAKGMDGWLVTLHQPSVNAILTFGENRALRESIYRAFGTRASDQGPNAGQFDNSARIAAILRLRREAARLLGYETKIDQSLATKMAPNGPEVLAFLRKLAERARPVAVGEFADLETFARGTLGLAALEPWDVSFASNRMRTARHAIDEQAVRAYFPINRVLDGWRKLVQRLFGLRLERRDNVALWHRDAAFYDVVDETGAVIAGIYTDLHTRAGKRGGAWMGPARPRLVNGGERIPIAYLVCNFAAGSMDTPPLLSHAEVATLLHETGHCLHHILTTVDRPAVGGINGFEWDAIELPSQLMEDFAWDRDVLIAMSGHYRTGERLPGDLFERLYRARHFHSGMAVVRQIEFAMFDLLLHLETVDADPIQVIEAVRDEVAVIRPPAWHRFPHAFTHIFAGGYAAGYYSYLWAEVLAADGYQRFVEAGTVDRATGDLFRGEVLARGATRPAADSFRAFRGRDPDLNALLIRRGLSVADVSPAPDQSPQSEAHLPGK